MKRNESILRAAICSILLMCTIAFSNKITAQTTGDLAFTGYNAATGTSAGEFSFVILKPGGIPASTTIYFTDNGWNSSLSTPALGTNEGTIAWNTNSAITQFTEIKVSMNATGTGGTVTVGSITSVTGSFVLSASGDQILAYIGSLGVPSVFITGIQMNSEVAFGTSSASSLLNWDSLQSSGGWSFNTNRSGIPPGLISDSNAVMVVTGSSAPFTEWDDAIHNCTGTVSATSVSALTAAINDRTNWSTQNSTPYALPSNCTFSAGTAPAITGQPSNIAICSGNNATFSATASNAISYQWQENTGAGFININNGGNYSGANTTILTINNVTPTMNGFVYRMVATGTVSPNATSNNAILAVNASPSISVQPSGGTACAGDNVSFSVTASNTVAYQWQVNMGSGFISISNGGIYTGTTTTTLSITGATANMNGYQYRVVAIGNCASAATSNSVALAIASPGTWLGTANSAWNNTANWSCGTLPTVATDVIIPAGTAFSPVINITTAICNNVTINSGATLGFSGTTNTLEVKGSITNNGTFNASLGKIKASGIAQSLAGIAYKDLEISGSGIKTLTGTGTISGILTLTNGYLQLGSNDLTLGNSATISGAAFINSAPSSYIVTNGTGQLKIQNIGPGGKSGLILFPIGTSPSSYTPIQIQNTGSIDIFGARAINGVYLSYNASGVPNGAAMNTYNVNKTWLVSEGITGASNATVNLGWASADEQPGFNDGYCTPMQYFNSTWNNSPAVTAAGFDPYYVSLTGITSFAPFAVSTPFAPPQPKITLSSVNGNLCLDSAISIPFTLNAAFNQGNIFTAQLSNNPFFTNPVNIGSLTGNAADTIHAAIPSTIQPGAGYYIRIISTSPVDSSEPTSFPLTIQTVPTQSLTITGALNTCTGAQVYTCAPVQQNVQYTWDLPTGGTLNANSGNATVTWNTAGLHMLSVTASNICGTGNTQSVNVRVFSAAPSLTPIVTKNGNILRTSAQSVLNGVLAYQWFKDGVIISGATDSVYNATASGIYTVAYTNPCGSGPLSAGVSYTVPISQTINFPAIPSKTYGDSNFVLTAIATSGLPVSFVVASGPAQLQGDTVVITGAGFVSIKAIQSGDSIYASATVTRNFIVSKASQIISFSQLPDKIYNDVPFSISATASTGLPVTYLVVSGNAYLFGNITHLTGGGPVTIRATQNGNQNYLSAQKDSSFCVAANHPDTIRGYTTSCISTQAYYVDSIPGFNYAWSVSGGNSLSPANGGQTHISWTSVGFDTITVTATTGCGSQAQTKQLAVHVVNPQTPAVPSNLYPADSAVIGSFPFPFSWAPTANASLYDLYLWPDGAPVPATPSFTNLPQIGHAVYSYNLSGFTAGKRYYWKIVAKNACNQSTSAIQTFTIPQLPDLSVTAISAPDTTFSGINITPAITVKNVGHAATNGSWHDVVYLSADSILDASDYLLGNSLNLTALDTQQSYTKNYSLNLPIYVVGKNYLLVITNATQSVSEITRTNDTFYKQIYINQSPVPDLKVTSVISSGSAFSGQNITVGWQVKNQGDGNSVVSSWKDYIYVSPDSIFDVNASIKIGEATYNQGILYPDSTYIVNKTLIVPDQLFGKYYVYVVTDAANQVYESAFENNNVGKSDSVTIYLTPPPDFIITSLNAPQYASRGETVPADWTVENIGSSRQVKDSLWTDGYAVSTDTSMNSNSYASKNPLLVLHPLCNQYPLGSGGCRYIYPLMQAGDFYYNSATITLPTNVDSTYIHVKADNGNNIFEYNGESNNTARVKIKFLNPDLQVSSISTPTALVSGSTNTTGMTWTVQNSGLGKVPTVSRKDRIYLSPTSTFNSATAITLADYDYTNSIDTGASLTLTTAFLLSNTLSGTYYLFIKTDINNTIVESNEANNLSAPHLVQITMQPALDLTPVQVSVQPNTALAESKVQISYTVKNNGPGLLSGKSWKDKIYLSKQPTWNFSNALLVYTTNTTVTLLSDSTYAVQDSILLTAAQLQLLNIDSANCYFYLWTDADSNVFEHQNETNNIARSNSVFLKQLHRPDLVVIAASVPDTINSGAPALVTYTVKNIGGNTFPFTTTWYDAAYLSLDTILDANDIFLKEKGVTTILDSNGQYSNSWNFTVPNGLSGVYNLLLVADRYDNTHDKDRSNNYKVIRDQNGNLHSTYVRLTPPPDLSIDSLLVPAIGYSGQPYTVKWRVSNTGIGYTIGNSWDEAFFLSTDTVLSAGDQQIGTFHHSGVLTPGSFYRDSTQIFLPISAQGNYYLLMATDYANVIYEHTHENNNTKAAITFIIQPQPSDLIVSDIVADTAVILGDSITVHWTTKNNGVNPATGFMREGIYLSPDTSLSNDDVLLANPSYTISLLPTDTAHHTAKVRVKDLSPGNYYTLVRTDLLNNIYEQSESNNVASANTTLHADVTQLIIGTVHNDLLSNHYERYYRITIPDSLEGQTLSVSLKGDSLNGANELYLRHDTIPTRSAYDFAYSQGSSGNQQIIIPELQKGIYYVLVYGATSAAAQQQISLLSQKITFSIIDVVASQGGNTGTVTVKITGAKFQPNMKARLSNGSGTITASNIYYSNSTTIFATFNLAGQAVGLYNVKLVKPGTDSVIKQNAFTVVAGQGGVAGGGSGGNSSGGFYCSIVNIGVEELVGLDVQHPATTRVNRTFPMTIIFGNSGTVDVPIPTRTLISIAGFPISFTSSKLSENKKELFLEFRETNGPPNVLRPGAVGYITVFTSSNGAGVMEFKIFE